MAMSSLHAENLETDERGGGGGRGEEGQSFEIDIRELKRARFRDADGSRNRIFRLLGPNRLLDFYTSQDSEQCECGYVRAS